MERKKSNLKLINDIVVEEVVEVKEVAEEKQVVKETSEVIEDTSEVNDKKEDVVKSVSKPTRKYDSNISFAEMIKRN